MKVSQAYNNTRKAGYALDFIVKITRQWNSTLSRVLFQTKCAVYTAVCVLCKTRPTFPGINGPYEVHASRSFHSKSMVHIALFFFALWSYLCGPR